MYLIDSDVMITAKNFHYGFDLAPGFWQWMSQAHLDGKVFTVQAVVDEVIGAGDELSQWVAAQPASFKLKPQPSDATALQTVSNWAVGAVGAPYRQGADQVFLAAADYFLVAQALSLGYTVVTGEQPAPLGISRIKIPDACAAVGVPWMSLFQMLKAEGAKFGLTT